VEPARTFHEKKCFVNSHGIQSSIHRECARAMAWNTIFNI
jgi:hypothetical protein